MRVFTGIFSVCLIFCFCAREPETLVKSDALFRVVLPDHSGVEFANNIKEDEQQNFLRYPYFYNGGGVALGDLNNDGLADIYFTGNMVGDHLYMNQGNLKFSEVTQRAGILKTNLWTTGVTMADVNNDGWLDIYVCRSGQRSFRHNLLYINQGNGKFVERAKLYGLNDNGYSVQATFFDYDLDGDLDMYLVNHSVKFFDGQDQLFDSKNNPHPSEADRLYRNSGVSEGSDQVIYEDVSEQAGIRHFAFGLSASIADINLDGFPDIYLASDFFEPDFLYVNQGDGHFINNIDEWIGHTSFSSMGSDIADYNNDGLPDIVVCDMQSADNYRKKANMASMDTKRFARMVEEGYHFQYMQNTLQLNSGRRRFSEVAELAGVSETDWSWGPLFLDLDNDGWKDLFISNGVRRDIQYKDILHDLGEKEYDPRKIKMMDLIDKFPVERLRNYSFKNQGNLSFLDYSNQWGIDFEGFSTGAAYADLDKDGDLDLVLNNLDDPASIYENLSNSKGNNYLQISLRGKSDNYWGFGASVEISCNEESQYHYLQSTRGFQSAVAPVVHFGLESAKQIDKIKVTWPNGNTMTLNNVLANQHIVIDQEGSTQTEEHRPKESFFTEVTDQLGLSIAHKEILFDDFSREVLLPHKYSQLGPPVVVGDVNGDGLDDFFVGGAHQQAGQLLIQDKNGGFSQASEEAWSLDKVFEDMAGVFFDADDDADLDLYVVSGSNEWPEKSPNYQDRLYFNNGQGQFKRNENALPKTFVSGSCVCPADFDGDGDLDLFIGGRTVPGQYPLAPSSRFLENENGKFTDVTHSVIGGEFKPGMVTGAEWIDYDGDQDEDLVLVGEWMPITLLENRGGKLVNIKVDAFQNSSGWWYSLACDDMDQDGDVDLVVGNLGLNYKYKASVEEPFQVYADDFDGDDNLDIVLGYFSGGELFPLRGRQCSSEQMPSLREKFPNYSEFASATLMDVYGQQPLEKALHLQSHTFASAYIENIGGGQFKMYELPIEAQLSAINGILMEDINSDTHLDLILAGNMVGSEVETARNDAGTGLLLLGNSDGSFTSLAPTSSGLMASGDVKSLAKLRSADGSIILLVGNNSDRLQAFGQRDLVQ